MATPALAETDSASHHVPAAEIDVRLDGIRKTYGDVVAVDRVDLEIPAGEFFTLLGPSGSGKTTTLRLIAGFERPDEGRIELGGADVTNRAPYERDVNTVFQDYALFPHMTVAENVAYGLRVKRVPRAERKRRVEEPSKVVRLPEVGNRKPVQLSGGQRQRIALARSLVNTPRVLLLDEPLGALDLKLRQEMQIELKRIQREVSDVGITFVYVTHDQEEALTMSDRLAVFNEGRIEQIGAPGRRLRASGDGVRRRLRWRFERPRAEREDVHGPPGKDSHALRRGRRRRTGPHSRGRLCRHVHQIRRRARLRRRAHSRTAEPRDVLAGRTRVQG